MEIKSSLLKQAYSYRSKIDAKDEAAPGRTKQADEGASAPVQGDRVSLSPSALLHTVAHAVAGRAPEVRQEKIDKIRERLSSGAYTIDSRQIAAKLLESDALLAATLDQETL
jgi:flagellar biosynthesis anti-sigma factor FlgM